MRPRCGARDGRLEPVRGVTLKQEPGVGTGHNIGYFVAIGYRLYI